MNSKMLSLLLAVIHIISGLAILLVSSWFIAACAIAGLNFNYMLPAVVIRALAIMRIGSGYAQMWLSHHHLLDKLKRLRLDLFNQLTDGLAVSRGSQVNALSYQTEQVASVWMAWVAQNAGILLALLVSVIGVSLLVPAMTSGWVLYLIVILSIYTATLLAGLSLAHEVQITRQKTITDVSRHIESASLWHMQKHIDHPDITALSKIQIKQQRWLQNGLSAVLLVSFSALLLILMFNTSALTGNPLVMLVPMALLSAHDWFGRALSSQTALAEYIHSKKALQQVATNHSQPNRIDQQVSTLEIVDMQASNTRMPLVDGKFEQPGIYLIRGSSGIGKSRLLMAIAGLVPFTGKRFINGETSAQGIINDCLYIEQFPYCLSDTLRNNLLIANQKASDGQMKSHLSLLGMHYLQDLEQWIGDKGRSFSGGEKKRLGVLRAMLAEQSVLLIDEPFEALDNANQQRVREVLQKLAETKIVIIASHIFPKQMKTRQIIDLETCRFPETADSQGLSNKSHHSLETVNNP